MASKRKAGKVRQPCPGCGTPCRGMIRKVVLTHVICHECELHGPGGTTATDAWEQWNTMRADRDLGRDLERAAILRHLRQRGVIGVKYIDVEIVRDAIEARGAKKRGTP